MKKLLLILNLLVCTGGVAFAQVASDVCLEEVRVALRQIDPDHCMAGPDPVRIACTHRYVMRSDARREARTEKEVWIFAPDFFQHENGEALEVSDGKEAFNWRKQQFVVYRTGSSLEKAGLLPGVEEGLLDHCLVKECDYVPIPGEDSSSHKRARLTVDAEGQKKYKVRDLEVITNPYDTSLVSIRVNFLAPSLYVSSEMEFVPAPAPEQVPGSAREVFLEENGELREKFQGARLMDYR